MRFYRDHENERHIWVDRGIDSRLDNAEICEVCDAISSVKDPRGDQWLEVEGALCRGCQTEIQAQALANDILGLPRPLNSSDPDLLIPSEDPCERRHTHAGVLMFLFEREENIG